MTLDLSVAMLVRDPPMDRLAMLVDYMSSVASEFVIVDTGSSREDLQKMVLFNKAPWGLPKVTILPREWKDDFAWARNEALPYITRSWTLILDPDELPSRGMVNELERIVNGPIDGQATGYLFFTRDYYDGRLDPPAEYQWHVRLFKSGRGRFYRALDELVALDGRPEHETRGTPALPKAPKGAYLIHSKAGSAVEQSQRLYERIREKQDT